MTYLFHHYNVHTGSGEHLTVGQTAAITLQANCPQCEADHSASNAEIQNTGRASALASQHA
jgi:hypothetical protein